MKFKFGQYKSKQKWLPVTYLFPPPSNLTPPPHTHLLPFPPPYVHDRHAPILVDYGWLSQRYLINEF